MCSDTVKQRIVVSSRQQHGRARSRHLSIIGLAKMLCTMLLTVLGTVLLAAPLRAQELEIRSSFAAPAQADTVVAAISVEEATRLVRKQTGGRVLNAESSFLRGQVGVKVRVLVDGARVVTLFVDDEGRIRGR